MKTIHLLFLTTTNNGKTPMKLTSCGKLIAREDHVRTDLNLTNVKEHVTCGKCKRTQDMAGENKEKNNGPSKT